MIVAKFLVTVKNIVLKKDMQYDGVTVLTYSIQYPEISSENYKKAAKVVNNYYKSRALEYQQYVEKDLYQMAVEQYLDDIQNGYPVRIFAAEDSYNITYNKACILSLYFDRYQFTGGAHGITDRTSQTWNLQTGKMIKLSELFECLFDYRRYIKDQVIEQIKQDPEPYFENYEELVEQYFNVNNFYCTPQGVVGYFQLYEIAPYASGIREFLVPYDNCVKDPVKKCNW